MKRISPYIHLATILFAPVASAIEHHVHGLADVRYTVTDGIDSYLKGDYGKYRYDNGDNVSLAQGALSYRLSGESNFSALVIANGNADGVKDNVGITEAYFQYKGLPMKGGYRWKMRGGLLYPRVSMTNVLTGWASPYTLMYSAINSWLAEELRHKSVEFSMTKLGKFSGSEYDFEVSAAIFKENDPAAAVLSWHGWTMTSRQSTRQESLAFPNSDIGFVPENSDVFLELDDRTGYHLSSQWTWHDHGKVLFGYYNNRGDPTVVKNVQWAWKTRFYHLGVKWQLVDGLVLIAQYLNGDTLMQSSSGKTDLVNNDYDSAFLLLSKKWGHHRITGRIENFSVTDNDMFTFDDNNEDGHAVTLNHTYQFNKNILIHAEYNWLDSDRPSRTRRNHSERLIERQIQLGARYFF